MECKTPSYTIFTPTSKLSLTVGIKWPESHINSKLLLITGQNGHSSPTLPARLCCPSGESPERRFAHVQVQFRLTT